MPKSSVHSLPRKLMLYACLALYALHALYRFAENIQNFNQTHTAQNAVVPVAIIFFPTLLAASTVFLLVLAILIRQSNVERLYPYAFLLFGSFYLFLFPPATVPDELTHFSSAYYVSNLFLCPLRQLQSSGVIMRCSDYAAMQQNLSTVLSSDSYASILRNFSFFQDSGPEFAYELRNVTYTAPLGYLFSAFGIAIARMLHLGFYPLFYLGRISNILGFALISYIAIRRLPFGKIVACFICLLPMTLHEVASYSYDGFAICSAMLFLSNTLYWIEVDANMTRRDFLIAILLAVPICLTKIVYIPMVLLLFLIPNKKLPVHPAAGIRLKAASVIAVFLLFIAVFGASAFSSMSSSELSYVEAQSYTLNWAIRHIPSTVYIFLSTLAAYFPDYIRTMLGSSLGWFQVNLTTSQTLLLLLFLFLACWVKSPSEPELELNVKAGIGVIVLISGALILASMFFSWTPMGSPIIEGVQGRYFLPLLLPVCLIFRTKTLQLDSQYSYILVSIYLVFGFLCTLQYAATGYCWG